MPLELQTAWLKLAHCQPDPLVLVPQVPPPRHHFHRGLWPEPPPKKKKPIWFSCFVPGSHDFLLCAGEGDVQNMVFVQRWNLVVVCCQRNIGLCTWSCPDLCGRNRAPETWHGTEPPNSFGGRLSHGKSPLFWGHHGVYIHRAWARPWKSSNMSDDEEEETQQTNKSLASPMAAAGATGLSIEIEGTAIYVILWQFHAISMITSW